MKYSYLTKINFMAFCCILGLFLKKLVNPLANVITDSLHIPGGISTAFSIMFLVIGVECVKIKHSGTLMAVVQGLLALILGRVGSMGILMPLSYLATGIAIDLIYGLSERIKLARLERMVLATMLSAFSASFCANLLIFRLSSYALGLYLCVSCMSGLFFGWIGFMIANHLSIIFDRRK